MECTDRIAIDPNVLGGNPVIKGIQMAVAFIIKLLAGGWTHEQSLTNNPRAIAEDVLAALRYARGILKQEKSIH